MLVHNINKINIFVIHYKESIRNYFYLLYLSVIYRLSVLWIIFTEFILLIMRRLGIRVRLVGRSEGLCG
jgi:hypothetical protein